MSLTGRDLISLADYSPEEIDLILDVADDMAAALADSQAGRPELTPLDRVLCTCFYEPSTRTRLSFTAAMLRLGGSVMSMEDPKASSVAKGETLHDTMRITGSYADVLVIRHPEPGSAQAAADATDTPVINAGDGSRNHPTQTLTDLFAIRRRLGRLTGLRVGLCGDLKYGRTVHSLAPTLARYGCELTCIAPPPLGMPGEYLDEVQELSGTRPRETEDLAGVLPELDVLYMTRIQRERFESAEEYEKYRGVYVLDAEVMKHAAEGLIVLHPLPRVGEIAEEVDADPRAACFEQAAGGVPVRMALLALLLGLVDRPTAKTHGF
jgi:aspartate carbamoyltransferase catalytic subunit